MSERRPTTNTDPLIMRETDKPTVEHQVQQGLKQQGVNFLGNFENLLPGGFHRDFAEKDPDYLGEPCAHPITKEEKSIGLYHSGKFLRATRGEFLADVDRAILQAPEVEPATLEELGKEYQEAVQANSVEVVQKREAYLEYALPVYVELRTMGYTHYDLWQA